MTKVSNEAKNIFSFHIEGPLIAFRHHQLSIFFSLAIKDFMEMLFDEFHLRNFFISFHDLIDMALIFFRSMLGFRKINITVAPPQKSLSF